MTGQKTYSVGMTSEFFDSGAQIWDAAILDEIKNLPGVAVYSLPCGPMAVTADHLAKHDILVVRKTGVPKAAFARPDDVRTRLIARFGVGYDHIDLESCTRLGVAVTITPNGVRRPVASSIVMLVLALAHRTREKDALVRAGDWQTGRDMLGVGLEGRTFGSLGFGNIAREAFRLLRPFGMRYMSHDPYPNADAARELGVELVDFDTLLGKSDFLAVNCPLTPQTRHIMNAEAYAKMKPTAFLINTARGLLTDQTALFHALKEGRLAGAGLDVFEVEPTGADNPLFTLPNVIAASHSMCWTDECARLTSEGVRDSIRDFIAGKPLQYLVNREVATQVA